MAKLQQCPTYQPNPQRVVVHLARYQPNIADNVLREAPFLAETLLDCPGDSLWFHFWNAFMLVKSTDVDRDRSSFFCHLRWLVFVHDTVGFCEDTVSCLFFFKNSS